MTPLRHSLSGKKVCGWMDITSTISIQISFKFLVNWGSRGHPTIESNVLVSVGSETEFIQHKVHENEAAKLKGICDDQTHFSSIRRTKSHNLWHRTNDTSDHRQ